MTREDLDLALDRMMNNAPDQQPGVIMVEANHWCADLSAVRATCASLTDGMRYRNIKILVSSAFTTEVLSRADAGERGEPYRDLTAGPETA
ncbi:hypothetical protein [Brevundimonas variabilis]|uniref:Uncharacterized protein n=1 Tax=Brevundimonas variabilis TaxID=74312 RepID=A0A7W9CJX9_9CAUL|nr:hypothetical protein [Brevundimonas variabilis]MBB5746582.1 hypothetical protein [Brevundimonas variabilis]